MVAIFFAALVVASLAAAPILGWLSSLYPWLRHVPLALTLAFLAVYFASRRFEYQVDSYAAWLTGDPEALITGLVKLHRLTLMPMKWGKWDEHLVTHPSTSHRLEAIARENGVSRKRLQEILEQPEPAGEPYPVPAALTEPGLVFSTAFRNKCILRIYWTTLAVMMLLPALIASLVWWSGLEGVTAWAVLGIGLAATVGAYFLVQNYLPVTGYAELRRRLGVKMQAQGIDVAGWGGTLVGFAPHGEPRTYEGYTNWDYGYLFLNGDRLCYVGEQTRFALRREQITQMRLGPGMRRWLSVPYLYLTWQDPERGPGGTFNVRAAEITSMVQLARATHALEQNLRQWWEQPTAPADLPPPLAELTTPALGEVTGAPVQAQFNPRVLPVNVGFIALLGAGVSLLCGLPFSLEDGGLAWYVPIVAGLMAILEVLPLWTARRPLPEKSPEPSEPAAKLEPIAECPPSQASG
jgi:hypothetical protein